MAILKGSYTADGTVKYLDVPIDATWIKLINMTQWDPTVVGSNQVTEAYWQDEMLYGVVKTKTVTTLANVDRLLTAANAITKINTGDSPLGTLEVHTGFTNAAPPVMVVADSSLYPTGSIVRLGYSTGSTSVQNIDFTVAYNDATHIDLSYMVAPGSACTGGNVTPLKWDRPWYPRNRYIASISQAANAVIQMTVTNEFAVGDTVIIMVDQAFGMVEANLQKAKVLAIDTVIGTNTNTITVDLDTTGFTAFAWPATGTAITSLPTVSPSSGPMTNTTYRGFKIVPGAANPGGAVGDEIIWIAGDSFDPFV